jgi:hypothetical protein
MKEEGKPGNGPATPDKKQEEDDLPAHWKSVQGAIWMLGLALLAWKGWWWPGILVLVAISGLTQAGLQWYLSRQKAAAQTSPQVQSSPSPSPADPSAGSPNLDAQRAAWLPPVCPQCGAPLGAGVVHWTGPDTGNCPYCNALIRPAGR